MFEENLTTLYRPVGAEELRLIEGCDFRRFPPRLPEQPIFYPVTTETYAAQIARNWNTHGGSEGFVTRFNSNIVDPIEVIRRFTEADGVGRVADSNSAAEPDRRRSP